MTDVANDVVHKEPSALEKLKAAKALQGKDATGNAELANAQRDGGQPGSGQPNDPASDGATGVAETTETKDLNIGQGENANGAVDAKSQADYSEAGLELGGVRKILREEGKAPEKIEHDVVQQGGGGTIKASGDFIR